MRSYLQADISSVQPVAARGCAGDVGHFAACHVSDSDMQWFYHTQALAGSLPCDICLGIYMGIHEDDPSLPSAFRQGV